MLLRPKGNFVELPQKNTPSLTDTRADPRGDDTEGQPSDILTNHHFLLLIWYEKVLLLRKTHLVKHLSRRLTLRPLRGFAGFFEAEFAALFGTWIALQEPFFFEASAK